MTLWWMGSGLLVLTIVRRINSTKQELDEPKLRRQSNTLSLHLLTLVLVIARAVNQATDHWVLIELAQELTCLLIVADLCYLEGNAAWTVALRNLVACILNRVEHGVLCLAGWLAVRDHDDEGWFAVLASTNLWHNNAIDNLVAQLSAHWC